MGAQGEVPRAHNRANKVAATHKAAENEFNSTQGVPSGVVSF